MAVSSFMLHICRPGGGRTVNWKRVWEGVLVVDLGGCAVSWASPDSDPQG